jgi:hypothetical protein
MCFKHTSKAKDLSSVITKHLYTQRHNRSSPMSTTAFFKDLTLLRLSHDDSSGGGGTREILSHVPTRKPNKYDFVRVHPDPEMSLTTAVFEDKEERETFFVAPSMRDTLWGEIKPVLLSTFITRQGVVGIWPLALPADGGRRCEWHETARDAAELAKKTWVRLAADMSLGAYRIYQAEGALSEPTWPDRSLNELLEIAFRDRIIDREDHPIVRRLRGLA